jgi:hypothetical protein
MVFALMASSAGAAEIKGKLKGVKPNEGVITITVDGKDRTFVVSKKTKFYVRDIRDYTPKDGVQDKVFQRKGLDITITTATQGGKEVVIKVEANTGRKG